MKSKKLVRNTLRYFTTVALLFLAGTAQAYGQGGEDCATAQTNTDTLPFFYNDFQHCNSFNNDYGDYGCGYNNASFTNMSLDWVFHFRPTVAGTVRIRIDDFKPSGFSNSIYVAVSEGCVDDSNSRCLAVDFLNAGGSSTNNRSFLINVLANRDYFIVVERRTSSNNCSSFDLRAEMLPSPTAESSCTNADFELNSLSGWNPRIGQMRDTKSVTNNSVYTEYDTGTSATSHEIFTGGTDPNTDNNLPMVSPFGGTASVRLGDDFVQARGASLRQTFNVDASDASYTYHYAVVFEDPSHDPVSQPLFRARLYDEDGNTIDCSEFRVTASSGLPGFITASYERIPGTSIIYKPWSTVTVDLTDYIGQNVTAEFLSGDCSLSDHFGYAYIDASCGTSLINEGQQTTICNGDDTVLQAPDGFASYLWQPGNFTGQNYTVNPNTSTTYTLETTAFSGCTKNNTFEVVVDACSPTSCSGANLVPNGDFESFSNCPSGGIGLDKIQDYINDWYQTSQFGTPDYFNTCNYYPSSVLAPTSGNASVGLQLYNPTGDYREYLQARLTTPLVPGNRYNLRFNIHLLEAFSQLKTDKIAVYFSTAPIDTGSDVSNINVTPQLVYTAPTGQYIDNVSNWETIEFLDYNATDAFQYITIGNFDDNVSTNIAPANAAGIADIAYYILDDVILEDTSAITIDVTATPDLSIITGDSASLFAIPLGGTPTYTWAASPTDPSLVGQETVQNPTVSPTQTTTYTVTANFGSGCTDTDTVTVTVHTCSLMLDATNASITDATCGNVNGGITGIMVNGSTLGETYQWTNASGTVVGTTLDISGIGLGSYTLTVSENGCTDSITMNINEVGLPDLDVSNVNITNANCSGTSNGSVTGIVFTGDLTEVVYQWVDAFGNPISVSGLDLTGVPNGSYTLTVLDQFGCGAVAGPFDVMGAGGPSLSENNIALTNADCGTVNGSIAGISVTGTLGNETYSWTDNMGMVVGTSINLSGVGRGDYTLTVTENGCSDIIGPFAINENGAPIIITSDILITQPDCDTPSGRISGLGVSGTNGTETYTWFDGNRNDVGNVLDLSNAAPGEYTLVIEQDGCTVTAGPYAINTPTDCNLDLRDTPIRIANTMTPNGDGANDTFVIQGLEYYPNHQLYIYNRWGNKIYESNNYQNDWNGTYKGAPVPVGTYYYVLELTAEKKSLSGYLSLLR